MFWLVDGIGNGKLNDTNARNNTRESFVNVFVCMCMCRAWCGFISFINFLQVFSHVFCFWFFSLYFFVN